MRSSTLVRHIWSAEPIYVEIRIRTPMDELWRRTQTPDVYARWDLRFTEIDYLPKPDPDAPQHFRYATTVGPLTITGEGSTVGNQERPGSRTSALRFGTDDPKSLIRHGSGYWQYVETNDGVRFLTQYSYTPRWGSLGVVVDRLLFRRLLGWGTAWSFDRLRLWLERDVDPATSLRAGVIHATARWSLASIWLYHGIVPKLLYPHTGEREIVRAMGFSDDAARRIVTLAGWGEVGAGIGTIALWTRREVFPASGVLFAVLAAGALRRRRDLFQAPFNPASLSIAAIGLTVAGYLAASDAPTARNCLRKKP